MNVNKIMVANIKIGALGITPESHPQLFQYLQGIGEVITLSPTTMRAKYDLIVLPYGTGISPNLDCFKHANRTLLPTVPILPIIEKFRQESLSYYMTQDTYIIGLGDNAALLWDWFGGKAIPTSQGVWCIGDGSIVDEVFEIDEDVVSSFRKHNVFGLTEMTHKKGVMGLAQILSIIRDEIKESWLEPTIEEEANKAQPKPALRGELTWPDEADISVNKLYEDSV
jgi:hypothetical protein